MSPAREPRRILVAMPPSMSERAYLEVKHLITQGELQPGDRLNVRALGKRLGFSATPLKTALAALNRDGLATAELNRGYYVTVLDDRDVAELFGLREALEPYAARTAVRRGIATAAVADLRRQITTQRRAAQAENYAAYNDLSQDFHRALWRLGDNLRLNDLMDGVIGQMSLVTAFTSRAPGRLGQAIDEHARMVDLCESGRANALADLVAAHVRGSHRAYRGSVNLDHEDVESSAD